jgi:hypothetical protein
MFMVNLFGKPRTCNGCREKADKKYLLAPMGERAQSLSGDRGARDTLMHQAEQLRSAATEYRQVCLLTHVAVALTGAAFT